MTHEEKMKIYEDLYAKNAITKEEYEREKKEIEDSIKLEQQNKKAEKATPSVQNKSSDNSGQGCAIFIIVLMIALFVGGFCWIAGVFDDPADEPVYKYLDTNGNNKADDDELRWTEDSDGNTTDLDW